MFASSTKFSNRSNVKFEVLEVRRLLATVIVNTLADETLANATTSLREAIAATAETVAFAPALAGSIVLNSELVIGNDLTIVGPGAAKIEISGDDASRVFRTTAGVNASISGVTISGGKAERGGGIYHGGAKLTLSSVKLVSNNARGKDGEYNDGQDAHGGAIYNEGELVLIDSNVLSASGIIL